MQHNNYENRTSVHMMLKIKDVPVTEEFDLMHLPIPVVPTCHLLRENRLSKIIIFVRPQVN